MLFVGDFCQGNIQSSFQQSLSIDGADGTNLSLPAVCSCGTMGRMFGENIAEMFLHLVVSWLVCLAARDRCSTSVRDCYFRFGYR